MMIWNVFGRSKEKSMSDDLKIAFADTIAKLLETQLMLVGDKTKGG